LTCELLSCYAPELPPIASSLKISASDLRPAIFENILLHQPQLVAKRLSRVKVESARFLHLSRAILGSLLIDRSQAIVWFSYWSRGSKAGGMTAVL
jgi:hypothetical protein